jgi:hypothetical protein
MTPAARLAFPKMPLLLPPGGQPGRIRHVRRTPGISCEALPASERDGAGMRRHVHPGNHAAESFVSFIPLFDAVAPQRVSDLAYALLSARTKATRTIAPMVATMTAPMVP